MFAAEHVPYKETGSFTPIVIDYLEGSEQLSPFYSFRPDHAGIAAAIEQKKAQPLNRDVLVSVLSERYEGKATDPCVAENINALRSASTFTVCTAHQPNLFTGPLYFIYKILHAIKLADELAKSFAPLRFVPVYYMGSEDADLEELNHTYVEGKKYTWNTTQTGAVGRMRVDPQLTALLDELAGQLAISTDGTGFLQMLERHFITGVSIQDATFGLVNELFGRYGLVILMPDEPRLKALMITVFEDDLFQAQPSQIVEQSSARLGALYTAQAYPRAINLFYLKDAVRERIEKEGDRFVVQKTGFSFSAEELRQELRDHPERFSPNVILRGLFQETVLPNVAFIGGGGELAYWLQLKDLFDHYRVPFPALVLRNSFLVVPRRWQRSLDGLELKGSRLFRSPVELLNDKIEAEGGTPKLNGEVEALKAWYANLRTTAAAVDTTLSAHVVALEKGALKRLHALEQKMWRAERRKRSSVHNSIMAVKEGLFPKGGLQERVENVGPFYAAWGSAFIDALYRHSPALEQHFTILYERSEA